MTYMPETNLSTATLDTETAANPSTAQKLKTLVQEGTARTQRIASILRHAFSETREEFRAGSSVISPLAKEVTTEAVYTFKNRSQQAAETVNQAWQDEADAPDRTERLISLIKNLAQKSKTTLVPTVEKQAKQQATKLDEVLNNRYGSRYTTLRDRFELVRSWIFAGTAVKPQAAKSQTTEPDTAASQPSVVIEVDSETIK